MNIVDILKGSAAIVVGFTEFAILDEPQECICNICRELRSAYLLHNGNYLLKVNSLSVGTVGIHRIEGIRNCDYLSNTRYLIALESLRIAISVRSFVMPGLDLYIKHRSSL